MEKIRVSSLSDGIFAIIITLLVFSIEVGELQTQSPILLIKSIMIYAICFIQIAVMWMNHHHLWLQIDYTNGVLIWLNFIALFFISLTPVSGKLLLMDNSNYLSFQFFAINMMSCSLGFTLLQHQANKRHLSNTHSLTKKRITIKNILTTIGYLLAAIIAPFSLWFCIIFLLVFPLIYAMPAQKLRITE